MIHHYLQKGFRPEEIINLPISDKMFYKASLEIYLDEEREKLKTMVGAE